MSSIEPREFLMIPGPTPVPDAVLEVNAKHPLGHRSKEFSAFVRQTLEGLKWLGETKQEPLLLTSSGTGAMDAAVANTINRGDKVLSLVCGVFGERFAKICQAYGAEVERIQVPHGQPIDPAVVEERLRADKERTIKAVTITHNETSTGVINDLERIAKAINAHGALSLVDAVTSFGATRVPIDEWELDLVVTGSQKALMLPPGLAILFVSDKAWAATKNCTNGRFYFDINAYKKSQAQDTTPFTPNVNLIRALHESLSMMEKEGKDAIFARHVRMRDSLRRGLTDLGLSLMVDEQHASPTITSIWPPKGVDVPSIRASLKSDYKIVVADGQEELKGKIFRIGHMGYVFDRDIGMTLHALAEIVQRLRSTAPATA